MGILMKVVNVEIFGIRDKFPTKDGGCGCPGGCITTETMGVMFDKLAQRLYNYDNQKIVQLKFINVFEEDLHAYDSVKKMMSVGFGLPYVQIDGKMRFFGGVPSKEILDEIKKNLDIKS
jgi:hypothetical protein